MLLSNITTVTHLQCVEYEKYDCHASTVRVKQNNIISNK